MKKHISHPNKLLGRIHQGLFMMWVIMILTSIHLVPEQVGQNERQKQHGMALSHIHACGEQLCTYLPIAGIYWQWHTWQEPNMHVPCASWWDGSSLFIPFWAAIRSRSHFGLVCIGHFKQLYRLCERIFVRTIDLQKEFSLSKAINYGSGKEMVWVSNI